MIFSYLKKKMGSFACMFSVLLPFLKIKLLVKAVHRQLWSYYIHNQYPTVEYALSQLFIQSKQYIDEN